MSDKLGINIANIGIIVLEFGLGSIIQEKHRIIVECFAFDSTTLRFYINNPEANVQFGLS